MPLDYELSEWCKEEAEAEQTNYERRSVLGTPGYSQVLESPCEDEPFRQANLCFCGLWRPDGSSGVVERE